MLACKATLILLVLVSALQARVVPQEERLEEVNYEINEGMFEGDINEPSLTKGAAQIPTGTRKKWPKGIVPVQISSVYNSSQVDYIWSALRYIEDKTRVGATNCVTFVPRTVETLYVRVINDTGCYSSVGQVVTGPQNLSLKFPGCERFGTVVHEFLHALGFWHEQSRTDRDQFVDVIYAKIKPESVSNFNKYSASQVGLLDIPYDYGSVLHYGPKGFSIDGSDTLVPKDPKATIGQRVGMSDTDILEVKRFYECIDE